jgi:quinolinate synthase
MGYKDDVPKLAAEVAELKKKNNAIILVHNYQRPEVQDRGDFVGDSLGLAQEAAKTDAELIVLCGVDFMAETAKLLNPEKVVLLPEERALCPMAQMITPEDVAELKNEHPDAVVVSYVNTPADVKAVTDVCCTSANAVKVVNSIPPEKPIIFTPDRHLGAYVQRETGRENMIIWNGLCPTHALMQASDVTKAREKYPDAEVVVHPEAPMEVIEMADAVRSTSGMLRYCGETDAKTFLIGTEMGMLYPLKKKCPDKDFVIIAGELVCPTMKMTTLRSLRNALRDIKYEIMVPEDVAVAARSSIERMLEIGRGKAG